MNYDELKELLCRELDDVTAEMQSRGATVADLDAVRDITSSIKNLYRIEMLSQGIDDDRQEMKSVRNRHSHLITQLDSLMQEADNDEAKDAIRRCKERLKQV